MGKIIKDSWALFAGYGLIMIAIGLQGNLLGIRSVIEGFNFIATGTMMSGYFVGYFIGANIVPNLVSKVGHVRVFAAFASMASLSILIHATFVNPTIWTCARFLSGMSIIGIFIVVESWLNDRANNRSRGKLLSVYMFITFAGIALGTLLLNIGKPENFEPFILVSLLLSIALIPILLTKRKPPKFKKIGTLNVKDLYKISPFGSFSSFVTGFIHSSIFTLGAVYATLLNFTILEISFFLFLITVSGAVFQWPIGHFSDLHDRRLIIILSTFLAAFFAFLIIYVTGGAFENMYLAIAMGKEKILFYLFTILYAGASLPIYTLNIAYVNDFISKNKFVAAGGGLQIIFGMGAMLGPLICSIFMNFYGPNGFFIFLLILHLIIGLFGVYRITRRESKENPDSTFTPLPRDITALGLELDPSTGTDLSDNKDE